MKKEKRIIIILILLLILVTLIFGYFLMKKDNKTAIIENSTNQLEQVEDTGNIRVIMNSTIEVKDDTMQNINFENLNDKRLLKCKIKIDGSDSYVYESEFLEPGKIIVGDLLDAELDNGTHNAIAEIYSYSLKKEKIGQVNVKISLTKY